MHCKLYHPCRVYFATNDVNPSDCCSSTFIGDPNLQKRLQDLSASDSEYISRSVPWKHRGCQCKCFPFITSHETCAFQRRLTIVFQRRLAHVTGFASLLVWQDRPILHFICSYYLECNLCWISVHQCIRDFEPRRLLIQPRILSLTFRVSHGGIVKEWSFLYIWIARQFLPYKVLSVLTAWAILASTSNQTHQSTNKNAKAVSLVWYLLFNDSDIDFPLWLAWLKRLQNLIDWGWSWTNQSVKTKNSVDSSTRQQANYHDHERANFSDLITSPY